MCFVLFSTVSSSPTNIFIQIYTAYTASAVYVDVLKATSPSMQMTIFVGSMRTARVVSDAITGAPATQYTSASSPKTRDNTICKHFFP
jgi:hypothetical protein